VARGGYRPGAGRPRGPNSKLTGPPVTRKKTESEPVRRNLDEPLLMTGTLWLQRVVNDPDASDVRRDRAAAILAGIENRRENQPTKKQAAETQAQWAGYGTSWWDLLHRGGQMPNTPPPPDIRAQMQERGEVWTPQLPSPTPGRRTKTNGQTY
jgi:hypothetical protein